MKKMLLMYLMIFALTVSCASTGSENAKSNTGENIPAGAIEAEEMAPGGAHP